jgi:hypothetical protein
MKRVPLSCNNPSGNLCCMLQCRLVLAASHAAEGGGPSVCLWCIRQQQRGSKAASAVGQVMMSGQASSCQVRGGENDCAARHTARHVSPHHACRRHPQSTGAITIARVLGCQSALLLSLALQSDYCMAPTVAQAMLPAVLAWKSMTTGSCCVCFSGSFSLHVPGQGGYGTRPVKANASTPPATKAAAGSSPAWPRRLNAGEHTAVRQQAVAIAPTQQAAAGGERCAANWPDAVQELDTKVVEDQQHGNGDGGQGCFNLQRTTSQQRLQATACSVTTLLRGNTGQFI